MDDWTLTALGFVAGVCTTFPQVLKAWRSADREAISKRTYAVASAAYVLWIVNGGDDQEYADHRLQRPRTATRSSHPRSEAARPYHPAERGGACCQSHWATTIGLVAGCLSSWSLVPQLLKCWRDGLTEAVSKKMFATRAFGLVLWVVYGFFGGSPPVMIFGSVTLVLILPL
jgi:MtN3 and saliva related transmembrane protein